MLPSVIFGVDFNNKIWYHPLLYNSSTISSTEWIGMEGRLTDLVAGCGVMDGCVLLGITRFHKLVMRPLPASKLYSYLYLS